MGAAGSVDTTGGTLSITGNTSNASATPKDLKEIGNKAFKNGLFKEAIYYHKKHEELADINGKFLALINLGLCYDKMGMFEESMVQY